MTWRAIVGWALEASGVGLVAVAVGVAFAPAAGLVVTGVYLVMVANSGRWR